MKKYLPVALLFFSPLAMAAINVGGNGIGQAILILIGWAIIIAVLWWGLAKLALDAPFNMIGNALLVILTVVVVVDFVATVFWGTPIFTFNHR